MKVLGVDPGLRVSGYAVVCGGGGALAIADAGVLRADVKAALAQRLQQIHDDIAAVLDEHQPDMVAVEELYAHYKHPRTAIMMGHARGVFLLAAAQCGVTVCGFSATRIKKSLTGNGRASKEQMQRAVALQLGLAQPPSPPDVADALAVAMCCLNEKHRELVLP